MHHYLEQWLSLWLEPKLRPKEPKAQGPSASLPCAPLHNLVSLLKHLWGGVLASHVL